MKRMGFGKCGQKWIWVVIAALMIPVSSAIAKTDKRHQQQITVMTRNLYLGADIFRVVAAAQNPEPNPDGLDVPRAVAKVFEIMQMTDFSERAEAIADEIFRTRPDVIGIQEASTYYIQTPSDFMVGNPVQANSVFIDFYSVLNAALRARGLCYTAYAVTNADIEMPMLDGNSSSGLTDVRLVDHDLILVKKGLSSCLVAKCNYTNNLNLDILGATVQFTRGFIVVDVAIQGWGYRVANTHLEVAGDPDSVFRIVQDAQMQELLGTVDFLTWLSPKPVVMVGDFNSSPEHVPSTGIHPVYGPLPYTPPYLQAIQAGYLDAWLQQKHYDDGYTSGFDEFVSDPTAQLTTRIDHIFLKPGKSKVRRVRAVVVGEEIKDMTPDGLWPSDHAGVVARIKLSAKPRKIPRLYPKYN